MLKPEIVKIDWGKIKNEYVTTELSYDKLCDSYNVSMSTLRHRAKVGEWVKLRKEYRRHLDTTVAEKCAEIEIKEIQGMRQKERKDADSLVKAIMEKLLIKGEINPELTAVDINALSSALEKVQRIKYKSYGIAEKQEIEHSLKRIEVSRNRIQENT